MELADLLAGDYPNLHKKIANNNVLKLDERCEKEERTAEYEETFIVEDDSESEIIEVVLELEEQLNEQVEEQLNEQVLEQVEEEVEEQVEEQVEESESEDQSEEYETDVSELDEEGTKSDASNSDEDEDDEESSSSSSQILFLCSGENDETNTVVAVEGFDREETTEDEGETANAAGNTLPCRGALNFAKEEFVCELTVEPKLYDNESIITIESDVSCLGGDLVVDLGASLGGDLRDLGGDIDIREVARDLLTNSCNNCNPKMIIDEKLRDDIADDLNEAIVRPSQVLGREIDLIILLVVPALAIDEKAGAICAYGIGQLVAHGKNYTERSKIFRGYAKNEETFENMFKVIEGTLN